MMTSPVYAFIADNRRAGTLKDTLAKLEALFSAKGGPIKVYLSLLTDGWNTIPGLETTLGLSQGTLYRVTNLLLKHDLISVVGYRRDSNRGGPDTRVFNVTEMIV